MLFRSDSRCLEVLSDLGISYLRDKYPSQLSGGERQVLAAARAFMAYPDCIIADEPTALLDDKAVERIVTALQREHARGATLIVATHDNLAVKLFHELGHLHLDEGRIIQTREPVFSVATTATETSELRSNDEATTPLDTTAAPHENSLSRESDISATPEHSAHAHGPAISDHETGVDPVGQPQVVEEVTVRSPEVPAFGTSELQTVVPPVVETKDEVWSKEPSSVQRDEEGV